MGAVVRLLSRPGGLAVVYSRGGIAPTWGGLGIDPRGRAGRLWEEPLVVDDCAAVDSFTLSAPGGGPVVRACISVPLPVAGRCCGRRVVMDTRPRRFLPDEVDFVQAIGQLLADGLDEVH